MIEKSESGGEPKTHRRAYVQKYCGALVQKVGHRNLLETLFHRQYAQATHVQHSQMLHLNMLCISVESDNDFKL